MENKELSTKTAPKSNTEPSTIEVSPMVIRRLPRYYRYLRVLLEGGRGRIGQNQRRTAGSIELFVVMLLDDFDVVIRTENGSGLTR